MTNLVKADNNFPIKKIGFSLIVVSVLLQLQLRVVAQPNNYKTPTNSADVIIETGLPNSSISIPFNSSLRDERFTC